MNRQIHTLSVLLLLSLPCFASDEQLQKAINAANEGRTSEAIAQLEALRGSNPTDVRVMQSLGLLYQSTGQYDEAISVLESATNSGGSFEATYALGLLYEEKMLNAASDSARESYRQKAISCWQKVKSQGAPKDNRAGVAERHLKTLSESK